MHCKLPGHNHCFFEHNTVVVVDVAVVNVTVGGGGVLCTHMDNTDCGPADVALVELLVSTPRVGFNLTGGKATPIEHSLSETSDVHCEFAGKIVYFTAFVLEPTKFEFRTIRTFNRLLMISTPLVGNIINVAVVVV
jgi:hypothetical protein